MRKVANGATPLLGILAVLLVGAAVVVEDVSTTRLFGRGVEVEVEVEVEAGCWMLELEMAGGLEHVGSDVTNSIQCLLTASFLVLVNFNFTTNSQLKKDKYLLPRRARIAVV